MELNQNQLSIIHATESKIIVTAAPASGKTTVIVERIKYLLESGIDPRGMVVITFTNSAAENLRERIGTAADGAFIGTVHGYANYLLLSYGVDTSHVLNKEDFDKLFNMIKEYPRAIRPVEYLFLDEAQDSTLDQFEFLIDMIQPNNYFLVGDPRQAIFRWANANPEYLIELSKHEDVKTYPLNQNYRNGRSILEYAKSIIQLAGYSYRDTSISMRQINGKVYDVEYSSEGICRGIKKYGSYGDWFILCRTNQELETMQNTLKQNGIPFDTFKRSELSNDELNKAMKNDTVKVLTIHAAKGLEAKYVVVIGAKFYNLEEKCISYVAATRAKDLLIWTRKKKKKEIVTEKWD